MKESIAALPTWVKVTIANLLVAVVGVAVLCGFILLENASYRSQIELAEKEIERERVAQEQALFDVIENHRVIIKDYDKTLSELKARDKKRESSISRINKTNHDARIEILGYDSLGRLDALRKLFSEHNVH